MLYRSALLLPALLLGLLCAACDDTRPRADPEPADAQGGVDAGDATPPDFGPTDRGPTDGAPPPDARLDAATPADAAVPADAAALDATPIDQAGIDASPADLGDGDGGSLDGAVDAALADIGPGSPDLGLPDGSAPDRGVVGGFVEGEARAADRAVRATISGGGRAVQADADGRFRLGPLPAGPVELTISAPQHQSLTRAVEIEVDAIAALDAPVLLYRGQRIGPAAGDQLRFSFDGAWLIWSEADALHARPTDLGLPVELLPRGFEVFLGFVPGREAIAVRRRVVAGLAGDIDVIDLADGRREGLFSEAQPWVRWRGEAALGMVGTRDGLSQLMIGRPGGAPRMLAEGVPWLLVTDLVDGEPAWVQQGADGFDVWRGGDAIPATPVAPGFSSSDAFLMTTPGRTGLLWLSPDGALIRWEPETGAQRLAEAVRASPRPRFIPQGLLFWRDDPAEPGLERLVLLDEGGERALIGAVDSATFSLAGDRYYVTRPEDGLWTGTLAGAPARLIPGERIQFTLQGPGVIALVDGEAWWAIPGGLALNTALGGLTTLQGLSVGATAWQAGQPEGGTLWWLPGPDQAAPPMPIVRGAPRARRTVEPGNAAVFALGADGYLRAPIPPGMPQTAFAEVVTEIVVISAQALLGWQPDGWLHAIDPRAGEATGWAASVSRVELSSDRRFVAYVSDRGTFLVPLGE